MSHQLIPVFTAAIGNSPVNAIDGRVLHEFLEVKSEFRNWIKNRITDYGFVQDIDYIAGNFLPGSERVDYHCSIGMGKELAMVERNTKGKQARQYFIECERRLLEESKPAIPTHAQALRLYADKLEELEAAQPKIAFYDQVVFTDALMDFTAAFSLLQRKTGQQFNWGAFIEFGRRHGFACKQNVHKNIGKNRFVPRIKYIGGWFVAELNATSGQSEWMVRPAGIAGIVDLIEQDRRNFKKNFYQQQEAA